MNILLYSSGVDSFIAYYYLKEELNIKPVPVFFDIGHRYSEVELYYVQKYRPETKVIYGTSFGEDLEQLDAFIPNRNAILLLLADSYFYRPGIKSKSIFIGGLADDMVEDNNMKFTELMQELLEFLNKIPVRVDSAFQYKLTKSEIVDWYVKYIGSIDELVEKTFSCYQPVTIALDDDYHCYSCPACFRRNVAFSNYVTLPFFNRKIIKEYKEKALSGYYPEQRNKQILHYINSLENELKIK